MPLFRNLAAVAAATFLFFSTGANAIPITYEFSGIASGSLGSGLNVVEFTNRSFTVDLFGDTSGVVNGGGGAPPGALVNTATRTTFAIAGIGAGTLSNTYQMYRTNNLIGFLNLSDGLDRISIVGNANATGYRLATAFAVGPITNSANFNIVDFQPDLTVTGSLMELFDGTSVSFRSFFPTAQIPEPASLLLLALGLAALGFSRRKLA